MKNKFYDMEEEKLPPELVFLLQSSLGLKENKDKLEKAVPFSFDWNLFCKLAREHRIFPPVYKNLRELNSPDIPSLVCHTLKAEYEKNLYKSLVMTGEMIRLVGILHDQEIPSLVLKGAPLAQKIYGNISLRMSKDIDLLVFQEYLGKAEKILLEEGYERKTTDLSLTPRQAQAYLRKFHHFVFIHPLRGVCVELHWKIHEIDLKMDGFYQGRNAQRIMVGGYPIPVLPNEEWLFFLIVHGGSHKWMRLRWLLDIEGFLQVTEINWQKIMDFSSNVGMTSLVHQTLLLLHRFFQRTIPEKIFQEAIEDKLALELYHEVITFLCTPSNNNHNKSGYWQNFWQIFGYRFKLRSSWRHKLSYVHTLMQPIEEDYRLIALPDALYPLYYLIRPITWLRRRVMGYVKGK